MSSGFSRYSASTAKMDPMERRDMLPFVRIVSHLRVGSCSVRRQSERSSRLSDALPLLRYISIVLYYIANKRLKKGSQYKFEEKLHFKKRVKVPHFCEARLSTKRRNEAQALLPCPDSAKRTRSRRKYEKSANSRILTPRESSSSSSSSQRKAQMKKRLLSTVSTARVCLLREKLCSIALAVGGSPHHHAFQPLSTLHHLFLESLDSL